MRSFCANRGLTSSRCASPVLRKGLAIHTSILGSERPNLAIFSWLHYSIIAHWLRTDRLVGTVIRAGPVGSDSARVRTAVLN